MLRRDNVAVSVSATDRAAHREGTTSAGSTLLLGWYKSIFHLD
jgi:hypothetical protein